VELREQVEADYKCRAFPGLEADDVMGVLATHPKTVRESQPIIISQDKDMQTIPTQVWRQGELINVTEEMADYYHMFQTLVGDTSDGYKGCPGVGKVKAEKILGSRDAMLTMWQSVVFAYEKAGLTEQDALTQARLARILRWGDWDNTKKEPILWSPS
jgi:DNA polymerase-1